MSSQTGVFRRSNRDFPEPSAAAFSLPGVDTGPALARLGVDHESYLELLHAFVDSHRGTPARVRQLGCSGDVTVLRLLAHTLKGDAASLGITAVRLAAGRLETAIRDRAIEDFEDFEPLALALGAAVATCIRELDACLPAPVIPRPESDLEPQSQSMSSIFALLERQLTEHSLEAHHSLRRLLQQLPGPESEQAFARIHRLVQQLQYDRALQALRQEAARRGWIRDRAT